MLKATRMTKILKNTGASIKHRVIPNLSALNLQPPRLAVRLITINLKFV